MVFFLTINKCFLKEISIFLKYLHNLRPERCITLAFGDKDFILFSCVSTLFKIGISARYLKYPLCIILACNLILFDLYFNIFTVPKFSFTEK